MLTPADRAIVAADPSLPALAAALDASALESVLARAYPGAGVIDVRPTYVRYKPGVSCILGFEARCGAGPVLGYLRGVPVERWAERSALASEAVTAPLMPGIRRINEICADIYILPNDAELGAAARLLIPESRHEIISRYTRRRPDLDAAVPQVLRYKPERRLVVRLGDDDGLVLKCYASREFKRALGGARAARKTKWMHKPKFRGSSASRGTMSWEWVRGATVSALLDGCDDGLPVIERLGRALASLHAQPSDLPARYQPAMIATQCAAVAMDLCRILPHTSRTASELIARLTPTMAAMDTVPALLHGDLSADQVIAGPGDKVTLIDFDRAGAGHPAYDIATFAARLQVEARLAGRETVRELCRAYQRESGLDLEPVIPPFTAAALLLLALEPFRRREADWPAKTESILAQAGEMLRDARTAA